MSRNEVQARLHIVVTETPPRLAVHLEAGTMNVRGNSYPANADMFFSPIIDWLVLRLREKESLERIAIDINFNYLNTSSAKFLFRLLKPFDDIFAPGKDFSIRWSYVQGDIDMKDLGEDFQSNLKMPVSFHPTAPPEPGS